MDNRIILFIVSAAVAACKGIDYVTEVFEATTEIDNLEPNSTTFISYLNGDGEDVTTPHYLVDFVTFTPTRSTTKQYTTISTEEPELRYLKFEYAFLDRETFWRMNTFVCINGTLRPSPYLQRKYHECEIIHRRYNPQCTTNCQMAITMLLESQIPSFKFFKRFFEIALPEYLKEAAVRHYSKCFEKFGKVDDFLDYSCMRPQPFFECMKKFQIQMTCSDEQLLLPPVGNQIEFTVNMNELTD